VNRGIPQAKGDSWQEELGSTSGGSSEDKLWIEYFSDPASFWDNRGCKENPRALDFKHKVTKRALRVDGWYTPSWVRERLRML
jgi:hypothetical protein